VCVCRVAASPRLLLRCAQAKRRLGALAASQSAAVQIENQILGWRPRLGALHARVGPIQSVSAHAEISHRLAQMTRKPFLPALAVADLVAVRKAIAVRIDAAFAVGKGRDAPRPKVRSCTRRCIR